MTQSVVTVSSRHEHLVLYDPAAIPADAPFDPDLEAEDPDPPPKEAIRKLAKDGSALVLHIPNEDCEASLLIAVNEEPDEKLRERGRSAVNGALLKLPGGKAVADGIEFVCRPGEARAHAGSESVELPPGDYEVEVLDLMAWKRKHRKKERQRDLTLVERAARFVYNASAWLGVLVLVANFFGAPIALSAAWENSGWRRAGVVGGTILLVDAIFVAWFWALHVATRRVASIARAVSFDQAFDSENPDIVVSLRQTPGSDGNWPPSLAVIDVT